MIPTKYLKKFKKFSKPPRYRYVMELPLKEEIFLCEVNCELPAIKINTNNINSEINYFSSYRECVPIRIVFTDTNIIKNKILFSDSLKEWYEKGNKINSTLFRIGPAGDITDRWDLRGCFLNKKFGFIVDDVILNYDHFNYENFI